MGISFMQPSLFYKMLSREDTPLEKTRILGCQCMNACDANSHQIRTELFVRRGVSIREGPSALKI